LAPRWLNQANPKLSEFITELLNGDEWLKNLDALRSLSRFAGDKKIQKRWMDIKKHNKVRTIGFMVTGTA
jgi:starch phosphorylase